MRQAWLIIGLIAAWLYFTKGNLTTPSTPPADDLPIIRLDPIEWGIGLGDPAQIGVPI